MLLAFMEVSKLYSWYAVQVMLQVKVYSPPYLPASWLWHCLHSFFFNTWCFLLHPRINFSFCQKYASTCVDITWEILTNLLHVQSLEFLIPHTFVSMSYGHNELKTWFFPLPNIWSFFSVSCMCVNIYKKRRTCTSGDMLRIVWTVPAIEF